MEETIKKAEEGLGRFPMTPMVEAVAFLCVVEKMRDEMAFRSREVPFRKDNKVQVYKKTQTSR